jgi:ribosome-binding protein aMBF1 (putative translation factor)
MTSKSIVNAREAAGLSQGELAKAAGVSRSLVAFIERGLLVTPATGAKIERALRVALARTESKARKTRAKMDEKVEEIVEQPAA